MELSSSEASLCGWLPNRQSGGAVSHLRTISLFLILGSALTQETWDEWLNEGVRAFKNGRYSEATAAFRKSLELSPSAVEPRLYFATA